MLASARSWEYARLKFVTPEHSPQSEHCWTARERWARTDNAYSYEPQHQRCARRQETMASTPRNGIADLSLEDDDSIKKMSEVAKFARQNNIPGYRPNGHHPVPKPQKQRSENSIRETPMSALRRRLSGWFGLSSTKPPRRANSLPGKISRDDSEHALSELKQSLSQSPRWQRRRKSVPKPPPKPRMPPPPPRTAPCSDWRELQSARGIAQALRAGRRQLVVFLDYDGTLTPIVSDPDAATLSDHMRDAVGKLSDRATVAIVSGRAREKLRNFVQLPELYYAGSHGFDIDGPGGTLCGVRSYSGRARRRLL